MAKAGGKVCNVHLLVLLLLPCSWCKAQASLMETQALAREGSTSILHLMLYLFNILGLVCAAASDTMRHKRYWLG